jgi:hypothetical protein
MNRLPLELKEECLSYFGILELINIKTLNREFYHIINILIRIKLNKDLGSIPISDRLVISGSYLVQKLLNERYENSDVDIFCYESEIEKMDLVLFDYTKRYLKKNTRYFGNTEATKHLQKIKNIVHYSKKGVVYECIVIDSSVDNISDFIEFSFDFDIVRNVYTRDKEGNYQLRIYNKENLINRVEYIKSEKLSGFKIKQRIMKYTTRGFKFVII